MALTTTDKKWLGKNFVSKTDLDAIMKEVVAGREHDLVIVHQQDGQNRRLDRLEKVAGISPQL